MSRSTTGWLVDGHVHLHACFDLDTFLDAAVDNFAAAAQYAGLPATALATSVRTRHTHVVASGQHHEVASTARVNTTEKNSGRAAAR